MTLPASGPISFNDINVELGDAGTTTASLGQASYRALAGVASGAISLSDFYGKSSAFSFTISSNQANADLRTLALSAGWNASAAVVATIDAAVYINSTSTGTPALTVTGSFPNGVELINNGYILGMGGAGGNGGTVFGASAAAGSGGGTALSVSVAVTVDNTGTIAGGGGGGGGGAPHQIQTGPSSYLRFGGGGGGGGQSAFGGASDSLGGYGGSGSTAAGQPGAVGTVSAGGTGGLGGNASSTGQGGNGGSWGSNGAAGNNASLGSGGAGGSAGSSVVGDSNITWTATGTRLGPIS
jgi:hypothetical protein